MRSTPLDWTIGPRDLVAAWPPSRPLAALVSGGAIGAGGPGGAPGAHDAVGPGGVGEHDRWSIFGLASDWVEVPHGLARAETLDRLASIVDLPARAERPTDAGVAPFAGGWIGFLAYELGGVFEPTALPRGRAATAFPLVGGWRCDAALVHDATTGRWSLVGDDAAEPILPADLLDHRAGPASLTDLRFTEAEAHYLETAARTVELIRAGDLFQANLARRMTARLDGSVRRVAATALAQSEARYGAVIELPGGGALVSMSPELFLRVDPSGTVVTRPIKGTAPESVDPARLESSAKDAAELHMIVDLMRNDLARVCVPGSVRVRERRRIERHATVLHGVAGIEGRLRAECRISDLLAATFPPGSVTGAPKIRAMQVIDELEPAPRGPYCGAIGFAGRGGSLELSVAIRTLVIEAAAASTPERTERRVVYGAGCGIVADSVPNAELRESVVKTRILERTAAALAAGRAPDPGVSSPGAAVPAAGDRRGAPTAPPPRTGALR